MQQTNLRRLFFKKFALHWKMSSRIRSLKLNDATKQMFDKIFLNYLKLYATMPKFRDDSLDFIMNFKNSGGKITV